MTEQQSPTPEEPPADAPQPTYEGLALALHDAQTKAEDHWNQLVRLQADMENLRRRTSRDVENAHKYAVERIVNELLPVQDSLELGLQASHDGADITKIREGLEMTARMMQQALEKTGVRELSPLGERFNPELHQAMSTQEHAEASPNTVVAVYQKGYVLHDRLVRPAMVVVAKAPAQKQANA